MESRTMWRAAARTAALAAVCLLALLAWPGAAHARDQVDSATCTVEAEIIGAPRDLATLPQEPPVALVAQRVYASDPEHQRVVIASPNAVECEWVVGGPGEGEGEFDTPSGVTLDSDGFLYVADSALERIQRFDSVVGLDSDDPIAFLDVFETAPLPLDNPQGLGIDVSGDSERILVADTGNSRIAVFGTGGSFISAFGATGDGEGELLEPSDVAACTTSGPRPGRLYVVDQARHRLLLFAPLDEGGEFLYEIGREGEGYGEFSAPQGVALDHQCNVYVADTGNGRVQMFSADGGFVQAFGNGLLTAAASVAVDTTNPPGFVNVAHAAGSDGAIPVYEWIDYDATGDGDPDSDGDALPDRWEDEGIDVDGNGSIDLTLPGADPSHKDLYVEVDFLPGQTLVPVVGDPAAADSLDLVVAAFAAAPVDNPDGFPGIDLHIQRDEQVAHPTVDQNEVIFDTGDPDIPSEFDQVKEEFFGSPAERAGANAEALLAAKRLAYRYALYAESICGAGTLAPLACTAPGPFGGIAEIHGDDFLLGSESLDGPEHQAMTFMHELGHALGLRHGGDTDTGCKANYLSIMNYMFRPGIPTSAPSPFGYRRLDYSGEALAPLDETDLDESAGIGLDSVGPGGSETDWTFWSYDGLTVRAGRGDGPLDWDGDGAITAGVAVDLNNFPTDYCDHPSPGQMLTGHDDWAALRYGFRHSPNFGALVHPVVEDEEMPEEDYLRIWQFWEKFFERKYTYSAKYVCVDEVGPEGGAVQRGRYRTVINVHNPHDAAVAFLKKAVTARSEDEERGQIAGFVEDKLGPDEALSVDCRDIAGLFGQGQPVGDGFVVIKSDVELDVAAVYTTDSAVDVEPVAATIATGARPDLTVQLPDPTTVVCSGAAACTHTVTAVVVNTGVSGAEQPALLDVRSDSGLAAQAAIPPLPAQISHTVTLTLGPAANCFDPACTVRATVDAGNAIDEADESNNEAERTDEARQEVQYAAKFVCVDEVGPEGGAVQRGRYRTVVNVHNPHAEPVTLRKKAVIARSEDEKRGEISRIVEDKLAPDEALSVDCRDIVGLLGAGQPLGDGFVVLMAGVELDVTAVYTVQGRGPAPDIDVERIAPRHVVLTEPPDEPELPDLTVTDIDMDGLAGTCPGGPGTCVFLMNFEAANLGAAAAGPFTIEARFDPAQSVAVAVPAGGLGPGASQGFGAMTPPGGNCFDPDCTICVTVDSAGAIAEEDETNNTLCETRSG